MSVTPFARAQYGQQVKQGHVISRSLVLGEEGLPIFAEFDENGNVVRVIGEATVANGLDGATVMSGGAYFAYAQAFEGFKNEHRNGIAKGAHPLTARDYEATTFKTLPTAEQPDPVEINKPGLFPSTLTVLVRSNEQLFHRDTNPILFQAPINLKDIDPGVSAETGAVLLDKNGNVREKAAVNIGYRVAYFAKEDAGIQDTSRDGATRYERGDVRLGPLEGVLVSSSLSGNVKAQTDEDGKFFLSYQTPLCPGFSYDIETLVMAEMTYRNFNPKARTPWSPYYVRSPSLDSCFGYGYGTIPTTLIGQMAAIGARAVTNSMSTGIRHHELKVDIIMFAGEATVTNGEGAPPIESGLTSYDPGEDPESGVEWPEGEPDPANRLVQGETWDTDDDGLHDLLVATNFTGGEKSRFTMRQTSLGSWKSRPWKRLWRQRSWPWPTLKGRTYLSMPPSGARCA